MGSTRSSNAVIHISDSPFTCIYDNPPPPPTLPSSLHIRHIIGKPIIAPSRQSIPLLQNSLVNHHHNVLDLCLSIVLSNVNISHNRQRILGYQRYHAFLPSDRQAVHKTGIGRPQMRNMTSEVPNQPNRTSLGFGASGAPVSFPIVPQLVSAGTSNNVKIIPSALGPHTQAACP